MPKLQEGHEYEFRVRAENAFGSSDPLTSDEPTLAKDPFGAPGKPGKPQITDTDVDHIDLKVLIEDCIIDYSIIDWLNMHGDQSF